MKVSGAAWSDEQILDVLRRLAARETKADIARSYGVTPRSIRRMLAGRRASQLAHEFSVGMHERAERQPSAARERCSHADEYRAIRPPTCGCQTCADKWDTALRGTVGQFENSPGARPVCASNYATPRSNAGSNSYTEGPRESASLPGAGRPALSTTGTRDTIPSAAPPPAPDVDKLVRFCATRPRTLRDVCDALECSPRHAEQLLAAARTGGYTVDLAGDAVAWTPAEKLEGEGAIEMPAPVTGKRTHLLSLSDQHCGSKHHRRHLLHEVIGVGYERGARVALLPGDNVAGIDRSGRKWAWDLSHHGLEDQLEEVHLSHPEHPGLTYHFIDGNHCDSFRHATGQRTGDALVRFMLEKHHRRDWRYYGVGGGKVWLRSQGVRRPVCVHLLHPDGGTPYSLSYRLQQHLHGYSPGTKPDILLAGHLHQLAYVCERGVHAMLCPSFEAPESSYSKRKARPTTLGGLLLSYELTEQGTIRGFAMEPRVYYEHEKARVFDAPDEGELEKDTTGRTALEAAIDDLRTAIERLARAA